MNYPIPRYQDSLILAKAEKIANTLAKTKWRFSATDERHELFSIEIPAETKSPWAHNEVAKKLAISSGTSGHQFSLSIDGRTVFQVTRQEGQLRDLININREWFGSDNEQSRLQYVVASDAVGAEFGTSASKIHLPAHISDDLGEFVETRDQGLARLEELYTRFTQKLIEERERLAEEYRERGRNLETAFDQKRAVLDDDLEKKDAALVAREQQLDARLKKIDDRDSKHARRALRDSIISELNKRDTSFTLTKGTQKLRWPVWGIIAVAGLLFAAGLIHNAAVAKETLSITAEGFNWSLLYFVLKQVTYTAGLVSVIFFGIKWSDRWFREHANEELKSKTMQIDILRANWVVETLLEWKSEGNPIPAELVGKLTHNLFRYPDESHSNNDVSSVASLLLGSAAKAKLKVGSDNEIQFSRAGAQKLSKHLSGDGA
jgi:hypothetical protein